eukprot:gene33426-59320_t
MPSIFSAKGQEWQMKAAMMGMFTAYGRMDEGGDKDPMKNYMTMEDMRGLIMHAKTP